MTTRQIVALVVPVVVLPVMYPLFQLLARRVGRQIGWHVGLVVYWIVWGAAYPLVLVGPGALRDLLHMPTLEVRSLLLALAPVVFGGAARVLLKMRYEKATSWALPALLLTAVGNGIFEETIWRGTYMVLFPGSLLWGVIWPALWFAAWHLAPGSVSSQSRVAGLVGGAAALGLVLGWLGQSAGNLWWPILSHTLAGIIMVL